MTDKKLADLFKLNNLNCVVCLMNCMVYIKNKNQWKEIDYACCYSNCINTNNPIGSCIEGNGFVNIINDENIKYLMKNDGNYLEFLELF